MPVKKNTNLGQIKISDDAIASLAGSQVNECYGVVGMTSKNLLKDGYHSLLKKENYSKGVIVTSDDTGIIIDVYVVLYFGVKISEVISGIQQRVKYTLENTLNCNINAVNVHVEGVIVNE